MTIAPQSLHMLTVEEVAALAAQEAVIARGLQTFYEVGNALATIRDARLYRADYATFEAYCQDRWGLKQSRAYQFIDAAGVINNLRSSTIVELPQNEAQARPLTHLPPDDQSRVWQLAVETRGDGPMTAAHVAQTVEQFRPSDRHAVHFTSETPEWYTPPAIIETVEEFFDVIDLDPCSNSKTAPNVPARRHWTIEDNGLRAPWAGRVYVNPPYGREIGAWVSRACDAYASRAIEAAILLVPARTDTEWFRRLRDFPICFIGGRVRFIGPDGAGDAAPFPSALAYVGDEVERYARAVAHLGDVWTRYPLEVA